MSRMRRFVGTATAAAMALAVVAPASANAQELGSLNAPVQIPAIGELQPLLDQGSTDLTQAFANTVNQLVPQLSLFNLPALPLSLNNLIPQPANAASPAAMEAMLAADFERVRADNGRPVPPRDPGVDADARAWGTFLSGQLEVFHDPSTNAKNQGEAIYWNSNRDIQAVRGAVTNNFWNSPGHRAVMLDQPLKAYGIAVVPNNLKGGWTVVLKTVYDY